MKQFIKEEFRTKLYNKIAEIESNSQAEIVVIVQPQSGNYQNVCYLAAACFTLILFTFLMFAPVTFFDDLLYLCTILAFPFAYFTCKILKPLHRNLIKKKTMLRNVEIYARAFYQKGGIQHTTAKIGTLFYLSHFEKMVFVVTDRGTEKMVPGEELKSLKEKFSDIFKSENPAEELMKQLDYAKEIFSKYIPSVPNDVNEIPDDLKVEF